MRSRFRLRHPRGRQTKIHPAGLLTSGSTLGPPSRLRSGMMGLRLPLQLRGSAGFAPASRTPNLAMVNWFEPTRQEDIEPCIGASDRNILV
jgi:hypothetical protein